MHVNEHNVAFDMCIYGQIITTIKKLINMSITSALVAIIYQHELNVYFVQSHYV